MKRAKSSSKAKCGVYLIINLVNHKKYVGSSVNVWSRISQHFGTATRKYKLINQFYADIFLYGRDNFYCSLLEECLPEYKLDKEVYWFDLIEPEYNLIRPSQSSPFSDPLVREKSMLNQKTESAKQNRIESHRTKSCREKCKNGQRKRMVGVFGIKGSETPIYFESLMDAARHTNPGHEITTISKIRSCLLGERKHAYGMRWVRA